MSAPLAPHTAWQTVILEAQTLLPKNPQKAKSLLKRLMINFPNEAEIKNQLGLILFQENNFLEAQQFFEQAIQAALHNASYYCNLGTTLKKLHSFETAVIAFNKAINLDPNLVIAYINLGSVYQDTQWEHRNLKIALEYYKKAIALDPNFATTYYKIGEIHYEEGNFNAATRYLEKACLLKKNYTSALLDLAICYRYLDQPEKAKDYYHHILSFNPDCMQTKKSLSFILLAEGNVAQGLEYYNASDSWTLPESVLKTLSQKIEWEGQPIGEKTLLLIAEQGIGDEILFSSCLPDLQKKIHNIIFACSEKLNTLYQRSFPSITIKEKSKKTELSWLENLNTEFDYYLSIAKLPFFFRKSLSDFPKERRIFTARKKEILMAKKFLDTLEFKINIGIQWQSSLLSHSRTSAMTQLEEWIPLFKNKPINFINLYSGLEADALFSRLKTQHNITIHTVPDINLFQDLEACAGIISQLDLVMAIPTANSHLAGALGIPTWHISIGKILTAWSALGQNYNPFFPSILEKKPEQNETREHFFLRLNRELEQWLLSKTH